MRRNRHPRTREGMAFAAALAGVVLTMGTALPAARPTSAMPQATGGVILDDYLAAIIAMAAAGSSPTSNIAIDDTTLYRGQESYAKMKKLTPQEEQVIVRKGTEPPFSGKYYQHFEKGVYTCAVRGRVVRIIEQVPLGLRLAEFRRPDPRGGQTPARPRRQADRDSLHQLRRSPGTPVPRRTPHA